MATDWDKLIEHEKGLHERSLRAYDQFLTGLCAAALSLSMTYYVNNWKSWSMVDRNWFLASIMLFFTALVLIVVSQWTSSKVSESKVALFRARSEAREADADRARCDRRVYNKATDYLNRTGLVALLLAAVLFLVMLTKTTRDTGPETNRDARNKTDDRSTTVRETKTVITTTTTTVTIDTMSLHDDDPRERHNPTPRRDRGEKGQLNEGVTDSDKGWEPPKEQPKDSAKEDSPKKKE